MTYRHSDPPCRPDMIDPALLRPGRLDKLLYVPLPTPEGRAQILRTLTRKTPLAPGLDVTPIGESDACRGFSGADLAALVSGSLVKQKSQKKKKGSRKGMKDGLS
jgi:ribosome biogenesis ATPase